MKRRKRRHPSGSVYVLVVVVVALVSVLGVGVLSLATTRIQNSATQSEIDQARLFAISGVELGLANANEALADVERSGRPLLDVIGDVIDAVDNIADLLSPSESTFDEGSIAYEYTDREGNALSDLSDGVWIVGTGTVGTAVWRERAFARIDEGKPLAPLASALHATGEIEIRSSATLTVEGALLTTDNRIDNDGDLIADVAAKRIDGSGSHSGSLSTTSARLGVLSRDAFSFYAEQATTLSWSGTINDHLIAPGINTLDGSLSSDGIYLIDTGGADLTIRFSRIVGTLLIDASAGGTVTIGEGMLLEPAFERRPTLIVRGSVELKDDGRSLQETVRNMNPPEARHAGVSDSDRSDTYSAEIRGLVHVIGDLKIDGDVMIRGLVHVDGEAQIEDGDPTITYDPRQLRHLPRHYGESPDQLRVIIQPDTWERLPAG